MSENRWESRPENNMWWPGAVSAEQQHQHYMHQQQLAAAHQQAQMDAVSAAVSSAATTNNHQMLSYKMANNFQNVPTTDSNVSSTSPVGAAGIRGYDYRPGDGMTGGNPPMNMPAPAAQWWYPPSTMDNMHGSLQNMQNNMQQNMPPAHTPPPPQQTDSQARQEESQRQQQEADRQREAQRQHQEAQRQHQEALQQHHQAIAEAQARHHQLQQQAQQLQQQHQQLNQLQNNHHQGGNNQQVLQQQHQIVNKITKGRMSRGKADAKPRGPMTAYAFFVQTCREEHKKQHPEENVVFLEFSKKCAERWKTMVDKEKKRFQEMAENDKKRYDAEMQNYTPPKGEKVRGKKRKQMKDPNAPKRSLSAFFWFSNDERGKVKAQNPEYGVGDIAKELGRRWADADSEMKSKYEALAAKDKARYDQEMTAYKQKNNPALQKAPVVPEPEEPGEEDDDEGEEYDDE